MGGELQEPVLGVLTTLSPSLPVLPPYICVPTRTRALQPCAQNRSTASSG